MLYVLFTRFLLKQLLRVPIFPGLSACRDGTDSDLTVSLLAVSFRIVCGHLLGVSGSLQPGNRIKQGTVKGAGIEPANR